MVGEVKEEAHVEEAHVERADVDESREEAPKE
jgi:hypothetical protein